MFFHVLPCHPPSYVKSQVNYYNLSSWLQTSSIWVRMEWNKNFFPGSHWNHFIVVINDYVKSINLLNISPYPFPKYYACSAFLALSGMCLKQSFSPTKYQAIGARVVQIKTFPRLLTSMWSFPFIFLLSGMNRSDQVLCLKMSCPLEKGLRGLLSLPPSHSHSFI